MTPLLLSVDTTHEFGSLALLRGDDVQDEVLLHSPEGFGHILYNHLDRLLARHHAKVHQVDCFAVASGPGSFTGVRIGLAAVKGLAEATGKPAVAVSNLQALAMFGTLPFRATLLDARRGEVYAAIYDSNGNIVQPEAVLKFRDWLASLPAGEVEVLSTDPAPFLPSLPPGAKITAVPRALAGAVGRIACRVYQYGEAREPAALDANYVRRSDAELFWKDG
ncbi:MAG TPA: tRNA (adenosine(37)-N6)-threonylcarbamoyltransferase complex dimerization subunit type 1 TsaB [Bryobacteraceae bacterium]|nr:tRNA (adenosine(37)-N6)-threonylcarbamoyltransferase complex dimerization subunit type 1 TsaB [Bryobacteraceae bacterium]